MKFQNSISIIGGAGHVGLPLSIIFASKGFQVNIIDKDESKLKIIKSGKMPFKEDGATKLLKSCLLKKKLHLHSSYEKIKESKFIIVTLGTPIDEYLNPNLKDIFKTMNAIKKFINKKHILIFRSTLFPGTTEKISKFLKNKNCYVGIANCPERITQGNSIVEIKKLPQIISGENNKVINEVKKLFLKVTKETITLSFLESELTKLFNNAWRYLQFSIANQFYMIAEENNIDFYKIHRAISKNYPRGNIPSAGFTAGPCLFKDTMQLASFNKNQFQLGYSAMLINENLPKFLVSQLKKQTKLNSKNVGILGMAFKPNSDDKRDSLAYKLKKELIYENCKVVCNDPFIKDKDFVSVDVILKKCKIIFIGCPHNAYKKIKFKKNTTIINCWNQ